MTVPHRRQRRPARPYTQCCWPRIDLERFSRQPKDGERLIEVAANGLKAMADEPNGSSRPFGLVTYGDGLTVVCPAISADMLASFRWAGMTSRRPERGDLRPVSLAVSTGQSYLWLL
jgi:hypothetical protein